MIGDLIDRKNERRKKLAYRLPRYRVTLVREGSVSNNNNHIRTPEDVVNILSADYDAAVVEMAQMLALDTKNKIIGKRDTAISFIYTGNAFVNICRSATESCTCRFCRIKAPLSDG